MFSLRQHLDMSQYFKVKIYDRYLVGLGPREVSVMLLEEGESSVTEVKTMLNCCCIVHSNTGKPLEKICSGVEETICFKFLSSSKPDQPRSLLSIPLYRQVILVRYITQT